MFAMVGTNSIRTRLHLREWTIPPLPQTKKSGKMPDLL
jgi:hypothetical protein